MSKEKQLLEIVAEILEVDEVTLETVLDEEIWDSLAVVTFISEVDSSFDIVVAPALVGGATTVKHLMDLI